jgi:16S rRNA (cytosine967-C5)-methyltransferase
MAISAARKIAFEILQRVEQEGAYASDLLHAELGAGVRAEDAGLATELVMGVLRWRRLLDFLLERQLQKPVGRLDLPVALALQMGLYQLRFLERVPARAAVHESVELVKRARKTSAATVVNAVLRKAASDARIAAAEFLPAEIVGAERLGILRSHPTWMVGRWLARFGETRTVGLLEANNRAPRLSGAVHDGAQREEIFEGLRTAGLRVEPGLILQNAFAVRGGSPSRTAAFREGLISIQDEASQVVPVLLGVRSGERVLDMCAAPGGKTAALARAAGDRGFVVASDRHGHRLRTMREQFKRLRLCGVQLVELDAAVGLPFGVSFDRILVDAPCSGSGTLGRHPEIRWRLKAEALAEFHALQVALLKAALERLAPGGRVVYSTCSLEAEENESVVEEVLRDLGFVRRVALREVICDLNGWLAGGVDARGWFDDAAYFRTLPGERETDGFFAVALTRAAE